MIDVLQRCLREFDSYQNALKVAFINAPDNLGRTPLIEAAGLRYPRRIMDFLLREEADINHEDDNGETALYSAIRAGNKDTVEWLVKHHGASVFHSNAKGRTPLHVAVCVGNVEVTKCLLDHDALINAIDIHSLTPLHVAASRGHSEVTQTLLKRGASIDAIDIRGLTPVHVGARSEARDASISLEAILDHIPQRGASENDPTIMADHKGWLPLHHAAAAIIDDYALDTLMAYTPDSHHLDQDRHGQAAIHVAAANPCDDLSRRMMGHLCNYINSYPKPAREHAPSRRDRRE